MNKKVRSIIGLTVFAALVSGFTLFANTQVHLIGPFWRSSSSFDSLTALQVGGNVVIAINGESTDSLRVGMVAFWSDTNKVSISATLADYNKIAGVVVGGASTEMQAKDAITDTSALAAVPGARVLILKQGRTWVLNDAAGAIAAGERVIPSDATQGRTEKITTAIDTNYRAIGKAVVGAAASKATLVDVVIK